jgi:hypothetical protein
MVWQSRQRVSQMETKVGCGAKREVGQGIRGKCCAAASLAKLKMNVAESFEICFIVFFLLIVKVRPVILCCFALLAGKFYASVAGAAFERVIGIHWAR